MRKFDYAAMLAENKQRMANLMDEETYDPVTGKGSPIERFELKIDKNLTIYLPMEMRELPIVKEYLSAPSLFDYVASRHTGKKNVQSAFERAVTKLQEKRLDYDFEYYGITCCHVVDKKTKKIIPFRMRKAQRIMFKILENARLAKRGTVSAIVLKARQFGGSTLIALWFEWLQTRVHENWHSSIATEVESQAVRILNMYDVVSREFPSDVGSITLRPFQRSPKTRMIKETGAIISIGTATKPETIRSADNALVHCSEVGLWPTTKTKSPEDLIQSLQGSLATSNDTALIMESTAKGVGNYFHQAWEHNDSFIKIFVPWFQIDINTDFNLPMKFSSWEQFIASWTPYEWSLWDMGATIEGINWYRKTLPKYTDRWRMMSENPSTPEEAFSSTGNKFYPPQVLTMQRRFVCPPSFIGDIVGSEPTGKGSMEGINLQSDPLRKENVLKIWRFPDEHKKMRERFVVSVDIGGLSERADWSVINVIDRIGLIDGGALERAALYRGHIYQDQLAYKAAQIAKYYENALLVVEINSLEHQEVIDTEGTHYLTVLDELVEIYPNLYMRQANADRVRPTRAALYGFHMNNSTKPAVMNKKLTYMLNMGYIEYAEEAVHEMNLMEVKDGKIANVPGKGNHDDIDVSTATAIYVSDKFMGTPKEIDPNALVRSTFRTDIAVI